VEQTQTQTAVQEHHQALTERQLHAQEVAAQAATQATQARSLEGQAEAATDRKQMQPTALTQPSTALVVVAVQRQTAAQAQ